MNCKEFENNISRYMDEELSREETTAFLAHQEKCSHCKRALENTERTVESLRDLQHMKAPQDISGSIIASLEKEKSDSGSGQKTLFLHRVPWVKKVSLAAVLVLVVTSALILSTDWLPLPKEDEMTVMESAEEEPGVTSMDDLDDHEQEFQEEAPSDEGETEESPGTEMEKKRTEEKDQEATRTYGSEPLGIDYGKWIILLLSIGVVSTLIVLLRNRKFD